MTFFSSSDFINCMNCNGTILAGPKTFLVVIANGFQFGLVGLGRRPPIRSYFQLPAGIGHHILDRDTRMNRGDISLAILAKAQHAFAGDHRRGPSTRQSYAFAPSGSVTVAWAGDV